MIAKASLNVAELSIYAIISAKAPRDLNSRHITALLDHFQHQGPNGLHQCLVFEPMGASAASLVEELLENKPKMYGKRERYPKWIARRLLVHTLRGLSFLHGCGIVHGDVQPGNILFSADGLGLVQEEALRQDDATAVPLKRTDGKVDRWAPSRLYTQQTLHGHVQITPELMVKLSDLGSGKCETTAVWASVIDR